MRWTDGGVSGGALNLRLGGETSKVVLLLFNVEESSTFDARGL